MIFFGHIGPTVGAACAMDRNVDLRLCALLSLAPDLIDKSIVALVPALVNHNSRNFGHSILGSLLVLGLFWALRRRLRQPLLLWGCYVGHFVLDRMWQRQNPMILLWPLFGRFPPNLEDPWDLGRPWNSPFNIIGETLGLAILINLVWRHRLFELTRLKAFLRTGRTSDVGASP